MANTSFSHLPSCVGLPTSIISKVERTISGRRYSFFIENSISHFCDESNDSTAYEADISKYLPLLTPKLTKKGKIAVHQPRIPSRTTRWWKAQCAFRGLPVGGNLSDLQERIRTHGERGLGRAMEEARDNMRTEYLEKVERMWEENDNNEKARLWPRRFLYETFLARPGPGKEFVAVVEVHDWGSAIEAATNLMGICCEMRKMPHHQTGQRTVVLGMDEKIVHAKFAEISREAERVLMKQRGEREQRERDRNEEFENKFSRAAMRGKNDEGKWDVSGKWVISCPYVQEQWGSEGELCELEIDFTSPTTAGLVQMWGRFDFISLTGVIRFVNPVAEDKVTASICKTRPTQKYNKNADRYAEDTEDAEDTEEAEDMDSDDDGPTPAHFLFSKSSLPSHKSRRFRFRWRGEETGEGEIQLDSDQELCSLDFKSPNALAGTFKGDLTGEVEFKGFREGFEPENNASAGQKRKRGIAQVVGTRRLVGAPNLGGPDVEWHSRNEDAYESARVGRWG